ncbi:ACT domain-containing protein [Nocardia sp. NBC_01377]|uniref:ACT domain-containing protein n=1 Tax=Nocardia sp. NBC_01377 TaxID=2903595 RepID=UPI0032437151
MFIIATRDINEQRDSNAIGPNLLDRVFVQPNNGCVPSLDAILSNLDPRLWPDEYVFTLAGPALPDCEIAASIQEYEGLSIIIRRQDADSLGIEYDYVAARITLMVNSSLHTVGLTAAISARLAESRISCNVVSGLHHDHLFVPSSRAAEVLMLLRDTSETATRRIIESK